MNRLGERGSASMFKGPEEPRHRLPQADEGSRKGRSIRSGGLTELSKLALIQDRAWSCKLHSALLVLLLVICCTFLLIVHSLGALMNEHRHVNGSHLMLSEIDKKWGQQEVDLQYVSHSNVEWTQLACALEKLTGRSSLQRIGLLNFNASERTNWKSTVPGSEISRIYLDRAGSNITWEVLYPEWIDEGEDSESVPTCPNLPEPKLTGSSRFDLIAVKLPCTKSRGWSRDVARLHLQISAAKLAASSKLGDIHVLLVTDCFPIPNLFRCKDLVAREGSVWLYRPDVRTLREKVKLPVGSCELALPLEATGPRYDSRNADREAYATILHSADVYVCGAIAAAQSIRMSGSKRDLISLVDDSIGDDQRKGLEAAGWKVRTIQRIRNPKAKKHAYNEWNYSKFRLWQLTDYDRVVFVDADVLVLRNIDFLFTMPEIAATGNNATLFNSGMMVVEPSECTFRLLMDHVDEIESYNGGDQGYLNEIFTWWHRVPRHMNFLKHFWEGDTEEVKNLKSRLFGAKPPVLYVLHYLGLKPWQCFRDYDCNWNVEGLRGFASDAAHAGWWEVHDVMPEGLRQYCLLRPKQKAALEWHRRRAEKAGFADGHWKREIRDERLKICVEKFCYWKSMLSHWGETNSTGGGDAARPPAATSISSYQST